MFPPDGRICLGAQHHSGDSANLKKGSIQRDKCNAGLLVGEICPPAGSKPIFTGAWYLILPGFKHTIRNIHFYRTSWYLKRECKVHTLFSPFLCKFPITWFWIYFCPFFVQNIAQFNMFLS